MNAAELPAAGSPPHPSGNHPPPAAAVAEPAGEQGNAPSQSVLRQRPAATRLDGGEPRLRQPSSDLALAPCKKCGVPNGWTAPVCWGCEADLTAQGLRGVVESAAAAAPATPATPDTGVVGGIAVSAADAPPASNVEVELPVLTSVVRDDDKMLAFARVQRRPRRIRWAVASALSIAAVAGGLSLVVGRDAVFIALDQSPATQVRATADARPEVLRLEAAAKAASVPSPLTLPVDDARPATVEPVEAPATVVNTAPRAVPPAALPPPDAPVRAWQRNPQSGGQSRPQLAAPRSEAARPLSVPPGPCTSAVYALGLCSAGQSPTKN